MVEDCYSRCKKHEGFLYLANNRKNGFSRYAKREPECSKRKVGRANARSTELLEARQWREGEERPHVTTPFSSESVYQNKDCPSDWGIEATRFRRYWSQYVGTAEALRQPKAYKLDGLKPARSRSPPAGSPVMYKPKWWATNYMIKVITVSPLLILGMLDWEI